MSLSLDQVMLAGMIHKNIVLTPQEYFNLICHLVVKPHLKGIYSMSNIF